MTAEPANPNACCGMAKQLLLKTRAYSEFPWIGCEDVCPKCNIIGAFRSRRQTRARCAAAAHGSVVSRTDENKQTSSRTYRDRSSAIREGLNQNNCYEDLCFGVFRLSVEIMPFAAAGTCVS